MALANSLFIAGMETTSNTVYFALLVLSKFPDVQGGCKRPRHAGCLPRPIPRGPCRGALQIIPNAPCLGDPSWHHTEGSILRQAGAPLGCSGSNKRVSKGGGPPPAPRIPPFHPSLGGPPQPG